ncbi:MAG: FtsQ-type POTRA domain-containing protein [Armatimonadota bacterium]
MKRAQRIPHRSASRGLIIEPVRHVRPIRTVRRRSWLTAHRTLIENSLWLLVGVLLVLSVWASPRMQPQVLIVHHVPPAAQSEIEARLRALWQRQPYSVWLGAQALERELQHLPWVAQAQVRPHLPSRLHIILQPREAFVEVRADPDRRIFIDRAGIAFQPPNPPKSVPGGVIYLSGGADLPSEGALHHGSPLWRAFQLLQTLYQDAQPTPSVQSIHIEPDGELSLTCKAEGGAPMQFRLGDAAHYQQQAQVIQLLRHCPPTQIAQWEYIDLKSPAYPAVKPLSKAQGGQSQSSASPQVQMSHLPDRNQER